MTKEIHTFSDHLPVVKTFDGNDREFLLHLKIDDIKMHNGRAVTPILHSENRSLQSIVQRILLAVAYTFVTLGTVFLFDNSTVMDLFTSRKHPPVKALLDLEAVVKKCEECPTDTALNKLANFRVEAMKKLILVKNSREKTGAHRLNIRHFDKRMGEYVPATRIQRIARRFINKLREKQKTRQDAAIAMLRDRGFASKVMPQLKVRAEARRAEAERVKQSFSTAPRHMFA